MQLEVGINYQVLEKGEQLDDIYFDKNFNIYTTISKFEILKYYEIALRDVENIIGVNSTSNFRIDKICMRIIPNYLGTFSSNNVPRMKK